MKHIRISLILISILLLCGCNEENKKLITDNESDALAMCFYGSIESRADSSDVTRSTLSGTSTDNTRKVLWEPSDSIYVTNGSAGSKFKNVTDENTDMAEFLGNIEPGSSYYAFFPYGAVKSYSSSQFQISLPSVQEYKADDIASESFPMVAQCVDNIFEFRNLCGILVLNLTGTQVIDSIRFSGTDEQGNAIKVSGTASVSTTYSEIPVLAMGSQAGTSVVLNCLDSNGKGVILSNSKATAFHIVLPTETYANFTVKIYSSDGNTMTIQSDKPLTIKRSKRTTASSIEYTADSPDYEFVDLGLSVCWATFNVGATKPEEYGEYYAWGETDTKETYNVSTYKWYNGSYYSTTKYNTEKNYGIVDNKMILEPEDDVAHIQWGGYWRMPSREEQNELINNCKWTWTQLNGVNGYRVTSNVEGYTDRFVFLPAAGCYSGSDLISAGSAGLYWNSSNAPGLSIYANGFYFENGSVSPSSFVRTEGQSVRPVCPSEAWLKDVTVVLNIENLSIVIGQTNSLTATVKHSSDKLNNSINWTSSNPSVASVAETGLVTGLSVGSTTIIAECYGKTAICEITVSEPVYEYVDLGLSVNWATFNVGANKPEEYGDYFAWGEVEPYYDKGYAQEVSQSHWKTGKTDGYDWSNYKYRTSGDNFENLKFSKYCLHSSLGDVDNLIVLDPEDDAAHVIWGDVWRMPTREEQDELRKNSTIIWTTQNGVNGYKITSNISGYTDRYIFLPVAGARYGTELRYHNTNGFYWSSTLNEGTSWAWLLDLDSKALTAGIGARSDGFSVRAVCPSEAWLNDVSVFLNSEIISILIGQKNTLIATVKHGSEILDREVTWSSSNPSVATVSETGIVTGKAAGSTTISATCYCKTATCEITVREPDYNNGHEYVDLGLSVKWATCNIGATNPEEYGDYYAWGETAPKTSYTWTNYKFRTDGDSRDDVKFSKYNTVSSYGPVDKKPVLDLEDDVANAKWGGSWRLPTQAELDELINDCTWKWYSKGNSTFGGVAGYKVTSKKYTNRFIFLPAAGYKNDTNLSAVGSRGYYWSSSLNSEYPYCVWHVYFNDSNVSQINNDRNRGFSVRPVCP